MIVETDQMQHCGEGTPMFSRYGKQTSNEHKCFTEKKYGSNIKSTIMESASKYESGGRKKEDIDFVLEKLRVFNYRIKYIERSYG
jgi:hypothetical protein